MLWLLFVLIALVAAIIFSLLPLSAGLGYALVLAWISVLIYVVFYRGDEVSRGVGKIEVEGVADAGKREA